MIAFHFITVQMQQLLSNSVFFCFDFEFKCPVGSESFDGGRVFE